MLSRSRHRRRSRACTASPGTARSVGWHTHRRRLPHGRPGSRRRSLAKFGFGERCGESCDGSGEGVGGRVGVADDDPEPLVAERRASRLSCPRVQYADGDLPVGAGGEDERAAYGSGSWQSGLVSDPAASPLGRVTYDRAAAVAPASRAAQLGDAHRPSARSCPLERADAPSWSSFDQADDRTGEAEPHRLPQVLPAMNWTEVAVADPCRFRPALGSHVCATGSAPPTTPRRCPERWR